VALTLPALPWLLDVFQESGGERNRALEPVRDASRAAAITTLAALAAGFIAARVHAAIEVPERVRRWGSRAAIAGFALVGVAAIVVLLSLDDGPFGALERQADEFSAGTPDLTTQQSRYGFDLRSERGDFWRVALDDLEDHPLTGEGAGGFRASYLVARDSLQAPEDPHSVEMVMASELGLPGVLLFGTFIVAAVVGALRSRRLGPNAAAVSAAALGLAAYWFVHASVEWFWAYPAITLPAIFALGAAGAPALLAPPSAPGRRRLLVAVPAVIVALLMVPLWLSERLTDHALDTWRSDLAAAYSDLDRAASLNPLADRPYLAETVIAESSGEPERGVAAAREAQERQPEDWTAYFLEARLLARSDRAAALAALDRAEALNPRGPEIAALRKKIGDL
jgi:O-antigen ligase